MKNNKLSEMTTEALQKKLKAEGTVATWLSIAIIVSFIFLFIWMNNGSTSMDTKMIVLVGFAVLCTIALSYLIYSYYKIAKVLKSRNVKIDSDFLISSQKTTEMNTEDLQKQLKSVTAITTMLGAVLAFLFLSSIYSFIKIGSFKNIGTPMALSLILFINWNNILKIRKELKSRTES